MRAYTGTVAITGMNATDNPGPGVAVAEALRADPQFKGRIVGLAYDAMDPGLYVPGLLDAAFLIPYPSAGRAAVFQRLDYIRRTFGVDVLLPTLDAELPSFLDMEEPLAEMGIRTFLPTRDQYERRSKARLDELRIEHGVAVPRGEIVVDPAKLYDIHTRFDFPIVVKSPFYGAEIVYTVDEAVAAFHRAAAKWGLPIIVQQFVSGEEYNVAAIGDGHGGLIGAVAMKKLVLTDKGKGWAGVTIRDEALMGLAHRVMSALEWRGPCEIEALRDAQGQFWLLEVNPRFPAWVDLTAGADANLPMAAVRLAAGEPVAASAHYTVGAAFVRVARNLIVSIDQIAPMTTAGEIRPASERSSA